MPPAVREADSGVMTMGELALSPCWLQHVEEWIMHHTKSEIQLALVVGTHVSQLHGCEHWRAGGRLSHPPQLPTHTMTVAELALPATGKRVGPAPHLGNTVEPALVEGM